MPRRDVESRAFIEGTRRVEDGGLVAAIEHAAMEEREAEKTSRTEGEREGAIGAGACTHARVMPQIPRPRRARRSAARTSKQVEIPAVAASSCKLPSMRVRLAVLLLPIALACGESAPPPDVVLLSVDTLRRDALRAFDPQAQALPNLDALAAESQRFTRAVSVASWTLPAHASLLTGLYPDRHGATDPRVQIASDAPTLAEVLKERGYQTIGITEGGYLNRVYGFDRGFERYEDRLPQKPEDGAAPQTACDAAASAIAARKDPRPLFLFIQTFAVHDYFRRREGTPEQLDPRPAQSARANVGCLRGNQHCGEAAWRELRALYAAEVRNLDACVGRLRAALVATGRWDGTLLILSSDHGEGFDAERARIHHGGRLHQDVVRIPLLARVPAIAPRDVAEPVSLIDVMPTLAELAGADLRSDVDGRSLARWLRGDSGTGAARPLFASEFYYAWWEGERIDPTEIHSRPRITARIDGDRWYLKTGDREELYDLRTDPRQEANLVDRTEDMDAIRAAPGRSGERVETPRIGSDEALREQLEALGYAH
jgi:arylsulfatase A-like enzyme